MAHLKTIDGEKYNVQETREEIYKIINSQECLTVGVVPLSIECVISSWDNGSETTKSVYEPIHIMKHSIVMYY